MLNAKPFAGIRKKIGSTRADDIGRTVYCSCLCVLILVYNAGYTFADMMTPALAGILSLVKYAVFALIVLNTAFISCELTVKDMLLIALCGAVIILSARGSRDTMLLTTFIVVVGSRLIPLKNIARTFLYVYIFILIGTVALYLTGVIDEYTMVRGNGMIRHSLGFIHPNMLGLCILVIQLSFLMAFSGRIRPWGFLILSAALAFFVYRVPNSRASLVCIVLGAFVPFIGGWKALRSRAAAVAASLIPWVIGAVSIVFTVIYDQNDSVMSLINRLSTGRINLAHMMYQGAGYGGLFGSDRYLSLPDVYIDNAYCRLFLFFGIAAMILFLAWCSFGIYRNMLGGSPAAALVLIVMAVYGFFELHTLFAVFNPGLAAVLAAPETGAINDDLKTNDRGEYRK